MRLEIPPTEWREQPPNYLHDLFRLDGAQLEALKARVKKLDGLVRLFVHPFFIEARTEYGLARQKITFINRAINALATSDPDRVPPLVIMEGQEKLPELARNLENHSGKASSNGAEFKDIYVVPTKAADNPEPALIYAIDTGLSTGPKNAAQLQSQANWMALISKLHELGVTKILVGGMLVDVIETASAVGAGELRARQCVGVTVNRLKNDFEVELSNLSYSELERDDGERARRRKLQQQLRSQR
jgi:hypothetical protein